jgi:hypothetical protein
VSVLPALNVNQYPDLDRFATAIRERLCAHSAGKLKHDNLPRTVAATEAVEIVREIDGVLQNRTSNVENIQFTDVPRVSVVPALQMNASGPVQS